MAHFAAHRRSYREMLDVLREYEGWRCLWRPVVGALVVASVIILPVAGSVASIYIGANRGQPLLVVLGVVIATGLAGLATALRDRRPWRSLVAHRLATYEQPAVGEAALPILVRDSDAPTAVHALRRAKLNPASLVRLISPPPDAEWLDVQIWVHRPPAWTPSDGAPLNEQIKNALAPAGIPARVAGEDVRP